MPGVTLSEVERKKCCNNLLYLVVCLFQLGCFIIYFHYFLSASYEATPKYINLSDCEVPKKIHSDEFDILRSRECEELADLDGFVTSDYPNTSEFMLMIEMPKYDDNIWEQTLFGQLQIYSSDHKDLTVEKPIRKLTIDARLAYSTKLPLGNRTKWKHYAHSKFTRHAPLTFYMDVEHPYSVGFMDLFELRSLYHDFYLLSIRLPRNSISQATNITFNMKYMNGAYPQGWLNMKSAIFVLATVILLRFCYHVKASKTPPSQLPYMLYTTGLALLFYDLPLDYFRLYFDMPYMPALNILRQGLFYAILSLFWIIFSEGHILIGDDTFKKNKLQWKYSFIIISCFSLPMLILCEHVVQLINPFNTIMFTEMGKYFTLVLTFISVIGFGIYGIIMAYSTLHAIRNIFSGQSKLPNWYKFNYQQLTIGNIKWILISILIFAVPNAIFLNYIQVERFMNGWNENNKLLYFSNSSVLHHAGIMLGLWDLHICTILLLYTPIFNQTSIV